MLMSIISAVTIDFWNTLVDSSNGPLRRKARNDAMRRVFEALHRAWDEDAVNEAFRISYEIFEQRWYGEQRTMRADESVRILWDHLGMDVPSDLHDEVVRRMELSILDGMPQLLPDAAEVLENLAAHRKLALISDTAMSPGSVLRDVLERHGVARYFDAMVFSDETGVSKPHAHAFSTALSRLGADASSSVHIGDIERTDIAGAKSSGMRAILFRGDATGRYHGEQDTERTAADAIAHSWREIADIIADWDAGNGAATAHVKGQG
jgi:HAD superfamily hydrolase (TIGR01509 family)